ncbi:MAG: serine/threonine-protein kinase [Candidatus Melainabacteria bacterium]|nr:serine/threonine-protein kinase [Candidatus Melainabacteria bacterium]
MTDSPDNSKAPKVFVSFTDPEEFESPVLEAIVSRDPPVDGHQLRDYKILEKIGEGAMAIVYKARQISTNRIVAIKTLKFVDQSLAERFSREVSIHSNLKHKNIVEAIECISTPFGRSYFVMEYLDGITLEDQLEQRGRCNRPENIAHILSQICEALDCAHRQGIIHRDVKPENIVLVNDGSPMTVKVLDFGVAKIQEDLQRLTKTGVVLGSPAYMSPEQCLGRNLDPRSDIYSLGVVAFELITGNLPYNKETAVDMMEAHCDPDIKPTSVSAHRTDLPAMKELEEFFERVFQVEPEDRPATISDFKTELGKWWKVANEKNPDAPNPFAVDERARAQAPRPSRVLDTMEVQTLDKLAGRVKPPDPKKESAQLAQIAKIPTPVFMGLAAVILIGLSLLFAFFLVNTLKH